jgi:NADH-ubiquinone oxidoreductase chain 5
MFIIVIFVSSIILLNSLDYLSIIESIYFYFLLISFIISMLLFLISYSLLFIFISWEFLGIISYLLINFWSSRSNHGIKAVVYNKVGDIVFLILLGFLYNYCYSFNFIIFYSINSIPFSLLLFSFIILFSKSAQLPFSS